MKRFFSVIFAGLVALAAQSDAATNPFVLTRSGLGGHNGANTPPAPPSNTVASAITPSNATILINYSGNIQAVTPSGGNPNTYTCALGASPPANFAVSVGCVVSTSTTQGLGSYSVPVNVTNTAGTAAFTFTTIVNDLPHTVAQSMSPMAFQVADTTTGILNTFAMSGAYPTVGTCALGGANAASFTMSGADNCTISAPFALTAGTYNITIAYTNAAGTSAAFGVVITSVSAGTIATPLESDIPTTNEITVACNDGVTNGPTACTPDDTTAYNQPFIVTVSNHGSIPVGTKYPSFGKIYSQSITGTNAIGDFRVRLPAGDLSVAFSGTLGISNHSFYILCAKDGSGNRLTNIFPSSISTVNPVNMGSTNPNSTVWIKDCNMGPSAAELAANITTQRGYRDIDNTQGGIIVVINSHIQNASYSCFYGTETADWWNRSNAILKVFDSDISGCGSASNQHNMYLHAFHEVWFIRSVTRDTRGSHGLKADVDKLIFLDSYCLRDTGIGLKGANNHSACINMNSDAQNVRIARSLIDDTDTTGTATNISLTETISRANAEWGYSHWLPPLEDIENDQGTLRSADGIYAHWASANFVPSSSTRSHNVTGYAAAAAAGAASISASALQTQANGNSGGTTLSTSTQYTVRVFKSDGTVFQFNSTPSAAAAKTATFPVPGNVPAPGISTNAFIAAVPTADGRWDYAALNPRFYNRNYTIGGVNHYFWGTGAFGIRNAGTGLLDLSKQANYPTIYFEDDMFYLNTTSVGNTLYQQDMRMFGIFNDNNNQGIGAGVPPPPVNKPGGATSDWPDIAGAGTYAEPLAGPLSTNNLEFGTVPTGFVSGLSPGSVSDFVWPNPAFFADISIYKAQGNIAAQFQMDTIAQTGQFNGGGDIRWLDSGGVLNKITSATANKSPMPTSGTTTLNGAHNAGVQSFTLADGTVCSNGNRIHIKLPVVVGATNAIFISTVDQVPVGNVIHTADALPRNATAGMPVACFTKAGAKPMYWIPPSNYTIQ